MARAKSVSIGAEIKRRAEEIGKGPSELAKELNTSRQNVHDIYERDSIDTELLVQISNRLDYDFFALYQDRALSRYQELAQKHQAAEELADHYLAVNSELVNLQRPQTLRRILTTIVAANLSGAPVVVTLKGAGGIRTGLIYLKEGDNLNPEDPKSVKSIYLIHPIVRERGKSVTHLVYETPAKESDAGEVIDVSEIRSLELAKLK